MEIRQLEYFVSVVETESTQAAEKQYVSQPCITHSIRKLEEDLGIDLFDHSQKSTADWRRKVVLHKGMQTAAWPAGHHDWNERFAKSGPGTIKLAIPPMIGSCLFPYLFTSFQTQYPHLTLNVYEEGSFAAIGWSNRKN